MEQTTQLTNKTETVPEENTVDSSPSSIKSFFTELSQLSLFTWRFFKEFLLPPYEIKEIGKQSYIVGYKSLTLVGITGFIMGLVTSIQSRPTLADFGAVSWLPGMVGISLVRELGPVITGVICAGKVGSGISAELASMKVTEQIDAMEVSGSNPFKYLVVTRIFAVTLMLPLLVIFADTIGMFGAFLGANIQGDMSFHLFFLKAFASLSFKDVFPSLIKSVFFGK